ncbi:MAG: hypothetical protein K9M82_00020 [Deltaproteobacteria bacterium]|nr:hypothetical protein [Deltaproteobacteria bacterium]
MAESRAGKRRPEFTPGGNGSLGSPVAERIAWAESCYREAGARLSADPAVADLLARFRAAAEAPRRRMLESGVADCCSECGLREGGSCCGRGIEDRYSGLLLLINRLLGRPLPGERLDPAGCFFLGRTGCLLSARHVICINYLCAKITHRIDPERLTPLRESEGEEIGTLFLLEERVRKVLRC